MSTNQLQESVRIEHKGRVYSVESIEPTSWKITDEHGRNYGTVIIVNVEGEGGDPVYGGVLPAASETTYEGSDWGAIARGIINQVDAE